MKNDTAVVIIDVQVGMFDSPFGPPVFNHETLLENLGSLIEAARTAAVPVIYIQHSNEPGAPLEKGTPSWEIHPQIKPTATDLVIQKTVPDSFHETTLQTELAARQIKKLVIAGLQTDYCVDTTCRRACSLGYDITLVQDGHSTWGVDDLSAQQIIDHHNRVLGDWFATVKPIAEIRF